MFLVFYPKLTLDVVLNSEDFVVYPLAPAFFFKSPGCFQIGPSPGTLMAVTKIVSLKLTCYNSRSIKM